MLNKLDVPSPVRYVIYQLKKVMFTFLAVAVARAGFGAETLWKPAPDKIVSAPQHCPNLQCSGNFLKFMDLFQFLAVSLSNLKLCQTVAHQSIYMWILLSYKNCSWILNASGGYCHIRSDKKNLFIVIGIVTIGDYFFPYKIQYQSAIGLGSRRYWTMGPRKP